MWDWRSLYRTHRQVPLGPRRLRLRRGRLVPGTAAGQWRRGAEGRREAGSEAEREGEKEGRKERGNEGGREGTREGERERGRERGREGEKEWSICEAAAGGSALKTTPTTVPQA